MRVLISVESKRRLLKYLKEKHGSNSLRDLSVKLGISKRTLGDWIYIPHRYIPQKFLPEEIELEKLNVQEDDWGRTLGGKRAYRKIVEKYGKDEIKRRQSNGGKAAIKKMNRLGKEFCIDIENPLFLEFYGVLLGDGWLSKLNYHQKNIWIVGVSGNSILDKEFFSYLKRNIKELFNRNAYIKKIKHVNALEMIFGHKAFVKAMNNELGFPIGKKIDLEINSEIYSQGYEKMKPVLRGIFDTDGSLYFDKTPANKPYPCISITMKAPKLIRQVYDLLKQQGFKPQHIKRRTPIEEIRLKGTKQLKKWMQEIGSSNQRHLRKLP